MILVFLFKTGGHYGDSETFMGTDNKLSEKGGSWQQWLMVAGLVYLLICAVGMIGSGFKIATGDHAKELFAFASNPFAGLVVGIVATSLIQSSSPGAEHHHKRLTHARRVQLHGEVSFWLALEFCEHWPACRTELIGKRGLRDFQTALGKPLKGAACNYRLTGWYC